MIVSVGYAIGFDAVHQSSECFDAVKRSGPHPHRYHVSVYARGDDAKPLLDRIMEIREMLHGRNLNEMIPGNPTTRHSLAAWFMSVFVVRIVKVELTMDDVTVVIEGDEFGL